MTSKYKILIFFLIPVWACETRSSMLISLPIRASREAEFDAMPVFIRVTYMTLSQVLG